VRGLRREKIASGAALEDASNSQMRGLDGIERRCRPFTGNHHHSRFSRNVRVDNGSYYWHQHDRRWISAHRNGVELHTRNSRQLNVKTRKKTCAALSVRLIKEDC